MRPILAACLVLAARVSAAQLPPVVRLGAPTASPKEAFSSVTSVVEIGSGLLLATDEKETRLTLIDLSSGSARTIGRIGSGPGEYRYTDRVMVRPGGGAYLIDFVQRRLLPISASGTFENTIAYPPGSMIIRGIDARGVIYGESFLPRQGRTLPDSMWIVRWDPATTVVDTLMKYDANTSAMVIPAGESFHAFAPRDTWFPLANGDVVLLHAADYRASIWSGGRQLSSARIPWEPVRVTDAEKAAFQKERDAQPVRTLGGGPPGSRSNAPPGTPPRPPTVFPETMAPFENSAVLIAPDGRLWVERLRAANDTLPRYDVVDARSGALVGRVQLDKRARVVGFGRASVYVTVRDEDDVTYVKRYAAPAFTQR